MLRGHIRIDLVSEPLRRNDAHVARQPEERLEALDEVRAQLVALLRRQRADLRPTCVTARAARRVASRQYVAVALERGQV